MLSLTLCRVQESDVAMFCLQAIDQRVLLLKHQLQAEAIGGSCQGITLAEDYGDWKVSNLFNRVKWRRFKTSVFFSVFLWRAIVKHFEFMCFEDL